VRDQWRTNTCLRAACEARLSRKTAYPALFDVQGLRAKAKRVAWPPNDMSAWPQIRGRYLSLRRKGGGRITRFAILSIMWVLDAEADSANAHVIRANRAL